MEIGHRSPRPASCGNILEQSRVPYLQSAAGIYFILGGRQNGTLIKCPGPDPDYIDGQTDAPARPPPTRSRSVLI